MLHWAACIQPMILRIADDPLPQLMILSLGGLYVLIKIVLMEGKIISCALLKSSSGQHKGILKTSLSPR